MPAALNAYGLTGISAEMMEAPFLLPVILSLPVSLTARRRGANGYFRPCRTMPETAPTILGFRTIG